MLSNGKAHFVCSLVLSAGLFLGLDPLRLAAQGTTVLFWGR